MTAPKPFLWREYLRGRGISDESIEKFGLTSAKRRIVIPTEINVPLLYNPRPRNWMDRATGETREEPKIYWAEKLKGRTPPPFPSYAAMTEAEVICEGIWDCILLIQHGIKAATGTTGASAFHFSWARAAASGPQPKVLLYDADAAGLYGMIGGAETYSDAEGGLRERQHVGVARLIVEAGGGPPLIARWPAGKGDGYDVTDHFREGHTVSELRADVLSKAVAWSPPSLPCNTPVVNRSKRDRTPKDTSLRDLIRALYGPSVSKGFSTIPYGARRYRSEMGISFAEFDVLSGLLDHYRDPGVWVSVAQRYIGKEIGSTRAAVAKRVERLHHKGLVAKRPDPRFQRANHAATNFYCVEPYLCALASKVAFDLEGDADLATKIQRDAEERFQRFLATVRDEEWHWQVRDLSTDKGDDLTVIATAFIESLGIPLPITPPTPLMEEGEVSA